MAVKTKKKAPARKSSSSQFETQAKSEAFLRTNPERSTLAQQLADARDARDTAVAASSTAANANVAASHAAPADYLKVHDDALGRVKAGIPVAGADDPSTGAGRDAAMTRGHLAAMLASSVTDAKQRELSAREGGQYAVGQANAGFEKTSGTISARLRALAQEQGVFEQGRVADLAGERTKLHHESAQKSADRKNARDIASAHDTTTLTAAEKRTKAAAKAGHKASDDFVKGLRSDASTGKSAAADLKAADFSRADADKLLAKGQKGSAGGDVYETVPNASGRGTKQQRKIDPKTGLAVKGGALPDIPQVSDPLARSIALDLAFDGGISRANVKKLIAAGVAPGQFAAALGAQTQQQRGIKRKPPRRPASPLSPSERAPGGT